MILPPVAGAKTVREIILSQIAGSGKITYQLQREFVFAAIIVIETIKSGIFAQNAEKLPEGAFHRLSGSFSSNSGKIL